MAARHLRTHRIRRTAMTWDNIRRALTAYNFEELEDGTLRDEQDGGVMDVTLSNTMNAGDVVKLSGGFDFEVVTYNAEVLWHTGTHEYAGFLETDDAGDFKTQYVHGFETDVVKLIRAIEALTGEERHEDWWTQEE